MVQSTLWIFSSKKKKAALMNLIMKMCRLSYCGSLMLQRLLVGWSAHGFSWSHSYYLVTNWIVDLFIFPLRPGGLPWTRWDFALAGMLVTLGNFYDFLEVQMLISMKHFDFTRRKKSTNVKKWKEINIWLGEVGCHGALQNKYAGKAARSCGCDKHF